jgi:hypothetical protein
MKLTKLTKCRKLLFYRVFCIRDALMKLRRN